MPAWSLSGSLLLMLVAPAAGDRGTSTVKTKVPLRVTRIVPPIAYRLPAHTAALIQSPSTVRDRRLDPALSVARAPIRDVGGDSVRNQLRDRMARRGGALDGRVEFRLTGDGGDVGLGGGLARVVDAVLDR